VIEVNPDDGYLKGNKTYIAITNYNGLIKFNDGSNVPETDDELFVSDSAFEGEAEAKEKNVTKLSAGPITYEDGIVTIPVLGQELKIGRQGGSLSGALPSKKFEADLPNVSFNIDVPFAAGVYATAGLAVSPSLAFEVSGGNYAIKAEQEEKSISIESAKVEGSIGLEIKASAGVGVGAANIVGLDAGIFAAIDGKATINGTLEGNADFGTKKHEVSLGMNAEADIIGRVGAFVKAKLGPKSQSKEFDVAKKTFAHFNYKRTLSLGSEKNYEPTISDFENVQFGNNEIKKYLKVKGDKYTELRDEDDE